MGWQHELKSESQLANKISQDVVYPETACITKNKQIPFELPGWQLCQSEARFENPPNKDFDLEFSKCKEKATFVNMWFMFMWQASTGLFQLPWAIRNCMGTTRCPLAGCPQALACGDRINSAQHKSISWLLTLWLITSPGHQHPLHWL